MSLHASDGPVQVHAEQVRSPADVAEVSQLHRLGSHVAVDPNLAHHERLAGGDAMAQDPAHADDSASEYTPANHANRAPEDAELADALEDLGDPDATTLSAIADRAEPNFCSWLGDRRNSRQIPHRLEEAGYVSVRNPAAKDGRFKVDGRRHVIYARRELTLREQIVAAQALVECSR